MKQIHINNPEIRQQLDQFLHHGSPRLAKMDEFNDDLRALERLFKSHCLSTFCVPADSTHVSSLTSIEWTESAGRIMYVDPAEHKPLGDMDFKTRDTARRENWLRDLFEEAVEELRKLNEADGIEATPDWAKLKLPSALVETVSFAVEELENTDDEQAVNLAMLCAIRSCIHLEDEGYWQSFLFGDITYCLHCNDWLFGDRCSDECPAPLTARQMVDELKKTRKE